MYELIIFYTLFVLQFLFLGVLQKFYYNGVDALAIADIPEEVDLGLVLLDGWLTKFEIAGNFSVAPTGTEIIQFGIRTNPELLSEFDAGGADYFDLFEDLAGTNDGLAAHGSDVEMPSLLALIDNSCQNVNDVFEFKKNLRIPVASGDNLIWDQNIVGVAGTITGGTIGFYNSLEQVVRPDSWGFTLDKSNSKMRFVAYVSGDAKLEKASIVPPCEGYYTNISIQVVYKDMDTLPYQNYMYLGPDLDESILTAMPDAVNEVGEKMPNISKNAIFQEFTGIETHDGTIFFMYRKHFGKKRIYINENSLLHFLSLDNTTAPVNKILIQADFIPKRGSTFVKRYEPSVPTEGDDFVNAGDVFRMPIDLANAQIEVKIITKYAAADYAGEIVFRLHPEGQDIFVDTLADPIGDILDPNWVDQTTMSFHGVKGTLDFHTNQTDIYMTFTKVLPLGDVMKGDVLKWDVNQTGGDDTMVGVQAMIFTLAGIIPSQSWTEDGDWLTMDGCADMNSPVEAGLT